jgi:hypothetical protein
MVAGWGGLVGISLMYSPEMIHKLFLDALGVVRSEPGVACASLSVLDHKQARARHNTTLHRHVCKMHELGVSECYDTQIFQLNGAQG